MRILKYVDQIGKTLIVLGLGIAVLGGILWLGQGFPWLTLGRLPGDISYQKDGFTIYFPMTTMLALSVLLILVFWIVNAVRR